MRVGDLIADNDNVLQKIPARHGATPMALLYTLDAQHFVDNYAQAPLAAPVVELKRAAAQQKESGAAAAKQKESDSAKQKESDAAQQKESGAAEQKADGVQQDVSLKTVTLRASRRRGSRRRAQDDDDTTTESM